MPAAHPLAAPVVEHLVHDRADLGDGADGLRAALDAHRSLVAGAHGAVVGPLSVAASRVEELRPLVDPDEVIEIALVADSGLMTLQEARHLIQDDTWLHLDHLRIALPDGFAPADATRALLDELAFTAPTFVQLPRTGYETALDVLGADGAECAAYDCDGPDLPTDGEVAAFVHGTVDRRVPFLVTGGLDEPVRDAGSHGLLNLLAATAAALGGGSTNEVATLVASHDVVALTEAITTAVPRELRGAFRGAASGDAGRVVTALDALGVLATD